MRGHRECSGSLFSYVSIEKRIPACHPLRRIRKLAHQALDRLNPTFSEFYAAEGRPSVPPVQLVLASLLQAFSGSVRSECCSSSSTTTCKPVSFWVCKAVGNQQMCPILIVTE